MRLLYFLLLAAPLVVAQPSITIPTETNPSPAPVVPPVEDSPVTPGGPCESESDCLNQICGPDQNSQRTCMDQNSLSDGSQCDSNEQCFSGVCQSSTCVTPEGPDVTDPLDPEEPVITPSVSPSPSISNSVTGPAQVSPSLNVPNAPEASPTASRFTPGNRPGDAPVSEDVQGTPAPSVPSNPANPANPAGSASSASSARPTQVPNSSAQVVIDETQPSVTEVITSVSNGQSIRVTRTRAGASPSGRVVNPSGAASSRLVTSGGWLLVGLLAVFV